MCPIDGTQAHRTRLTGGIDFATLQIEGFQLAGSLPDAVHFGMSRRVEVDGYTVGSLSDDDTVLGNYSTKRSATRLHAILRELNGSMHQFFFCHCLIFLD